VAIEQKTVEDHWSTRMKRKRFIAEVDQKNFKVMPSFCKNGIQGVSQLLKQSGSF